MSAPSTRDITFVAIQFLLFIAYAWDIPALSFSRPGWLGYTGLLLLLTGFCTGVLALIQLRSSFSPFPTPVGENELMTTGVFALARHPIYSGLLLGVFGYAVYSGSGYRLLIGALLAVLFYFKSDYEEGLLAARHAGYRAYRERVGRFFRWL